MILLRYRSPLWNPVEPAQSCHFSLNRLKHQPYQGMYNHIETWYIHGFGKPVFFFFFLFFFFGWERWEQHLGKFENIWNLDIPPSHSASSMAQLPRQFLDSFACIRPFESRGCVNICWRKQTLSSTVWAAVVPHQPGLRFFCFSRLCVGHSGGFFVGNEIFFCPYFLESYIGRPQFEHVWTSPKLLWFVCVSVPSQNRSKELSSDVNQMVAGGCSFSNSLCLPMFTLKVS